nr:hypothetical protein [uncultured Sulfurimonas sp.]
MIKAIFLTICILLLSACSFKSPPNQWQYKSTAAFESYTKNFLSSEDALAKNDLSRAIKHAKHSANLKTLARVYLGECALNISVGIDDNCNSYKEVAALIDDKSLDAYFTFITSKSSIEVENLNKIYKNFASFVNVKDFDNAQKEIFKITKPTSKLLAASLIKDKLSIQTVDEMINIASFNGYKKSVLFWLNVKKTKVTDADEIESISKTISILNSKD